MSGAVLSSGEAASILFGLFFLFLFLRVPIAFALALASLPILLIEPRLSTVTLVQETFNAYNSFILLAVPFFLLTAEHDEHRRHHRPADAPGAHHGRAFPRRARADQRRAVDLLRRRVRLLDRRCGEPVEDLHRGADPGRLRPLLLGRDHRRLGGARRDHPALDPDDRLGRHPERVDRRAVPGRHPAGAADRARPDGDRARLCGRARLPDLPEGDLARARRLALREHSGAGDAGHHHRRQAVRLVHGDRIRLHRGALRRASSPCSSIARWTSPG